MNRGASAPISSHGQSPSPPASWSHTSRPGVQSTAPPVCRTTRTWRTPGACFTAASTLSLRGTRLPARLPLVGRDDEVGLAVVDPARERVRAEPGEDDREHGPDARAREHGVGGLRDHREVDRDAVAPPDAEPLHHVRDPLHFGVDLRVGDRALAVAWLVGLEQERGPAAPPGLDVAVDGVVAGVERAALEPLDVDVARPEAPVLDRLEGLDPVDALGVLGPEGVAVLDRPPVRRLVVGHRGDVGALLDGGGGGGRRRAPRWGGAGGRTSGRTQGAGWGGVPPRYRPFTGCARWAGWGRPAPSSPCRPCVTIPAPASVAADVQHLRAVRPRR